MTNSNSKNELSKTNFDLISVDDIVSELNVSKASVRNWIKTGYLEQIGPKYVSSISFRKFKNEVLGQEKLTQRANKLLKDSHNHLEVETKIGQLIKFQKTDANEIGDIYENSLSESFKNKEGIYYTPQSIACTFFETLPDDCSKLTFCDPCCGTGNFLIEAMKYGFTPSNIFGFDTDQTALNIASNRLRQFEGGNQCNLETRDFLKSTDFENEVYDVIFTNPPWGKKISKKEREGFSLSLNTETSKDSSALFFLGSLKILNRSGYLGFLLQDAFFNIASYETVRKIILDYKVLKLVEYGKPFRRLLTKAKGIVLQKSRPTEHEGILCITPNGESVIPQSVFKKNPKFIFNFTCSEEEILALKSILDKDYKTLAGNASWGLGIVTGNNKKYLLSEPKPGYTPVHKGSDIKKDRIIEPSFFIPTDFSLYQQVAPLKIYQAEEKLVYKFISSNLVFAYDDEQRFFLNSANMLVLCDKFPISHKQLQDLLNSDFMNWFFSCVFQTHKILRKDLETIPIFVDFFRDNPIFNEQKFLDYLGLEGVLGGTYRVKKQNT